jgi:hypothetical protein
MGNTYCAHHRTFFQPSTNLSAQRRQAHLLDLDKARVSGCPRVEAQRASFRA